jgi:transcriptional regulator GlxA family with amidase domain
MTCASGPKTTWLKEARWVEDGTMVTSSGVSAGTDMALAVIAKLWGETVAQQIADITEYEWQRDASRDPFARFLDQAKLSPELPG